MSQSSERTRLLQDQRQPQYVFDSSIIRERKRRVKQFQCCLCVLFLCVFVIAIVVSVAYTINETDNENNNNSTILPTNSLILLLSNTWPLSDNKIKTSECDNDTKWNEAMRAGESALLLKDEIEKNITLLPLNSPSYKHQKVVATSEKARNLSRIGYQEENARKHFSHNNDSVLTRICHKNNTQYCNQALSCNSFEKFRRYNGSCNNLKRPTEFGVAYRPFRRALPPDYADGVSAPKTGKNGKSLPSARTISLEVHRPYYKDDDKFSVVLAVWGQFLDHDITATALSQGANGTTISCCINNASIHPECFPVKLDPFDPYVRYNMTCMEFVRSAPSPTCCLGPREQMNQVTSFIDGSVMYGIDDELVKKLRKMEKGEMNMYRTEDNRTLLPISEDLTDGCNRKEENDKGKYCFLAGDARSNENLHLTSMHLIWVRQHNFLAKELAELNPHWRDERIFQEARKIIGAQMQHITYNEFLPILLGEELMETFDLNPQKNGYFYKYNESVDASIANYFATAAFRFAHSIIPGLMKLLANDTSSPEFVQLHRMLFDPFKLYQPGELDRALKGAMDTTIEANDPFFTNELKQHLFEDNSDKKKTKLCGLDLVSLNIQRGRDHGLVGYNRWREYCGLRRARTFEQLHGDIDDDSLRNIQSVYRDVEDIDLYTGAVSEKPINGSILGPTLTCLILDQFIRIKYGDRFWYENPHIFTDQQLREMKKTSLSKIICDNADNVETAQRFVMKKISNDNKLVPCPEIQRPNLKWWKENMTHVQIPDQSVSIKIG